ncbi:MAG: hypothetical protein JWM92_442 [Candidatus Nomurabacteria bacterium]|nr:hypothetical protein [Candidatus Nomurabacteria bacterium]
MILLAAICLLTIVSSSTCKKIVAQPPRSQLTYYDGQKKPVDGIRGSLVAHPDTNSIKGKDGTQWFTLYDYDKKCLYITEHQAVYMDIIAWLPVKGIPSHYVRVEAPIINPITYFDPAQLAEISRRLGIALNEFRTAKIYNYNLLELRAGEMIVNGDVVSADQQKVVSPSSGSNSSGGTPPKYPGTHHH